MINLDELERLDAVSTKGPWRVADRVKHNQNPKIESPAEVETDGGHRVATLFITAWRQGRRTAQPDAALIAAARNALPELLRLARERNKYRALLEQWMEYRFCCSDTPSKEKLDKMLYAVEDATLAALEPSR